MMEATANQSCGQRRVGAWCVLSFKLLSPYCYVGGLPIFHAVEC